MKIRGEGGGGQWEETKYTALQCSDDQGEKEKPGKETEKEQPVT